MNEQIAATILLVILAAVLMLLARGFVRLVHYLTADLATVTCGCGKTHEVELGDGVKTCPDCGWEMAAWIDDKGFPHQYIGLPETQL